MYGLVNQGIETFIVENHGEAMWAKIQADAGIPADQFESIMTYDDDVTYKLVASISKNLSVSADDALKVFGQFWPSFARDTAIGRLFDFGGETFIEFLESLDDMHERMTMSLPELKPPSFEVEPVGGDAYILHYRSDRQGLAAMVIGLLQGLAKDYGVEIEVEHKVRKSSTEDHDQFLITMVAEATGQTEAA